MTCYYTYNGKVYMYDAVLDIAHEVAYNVEGYFL